MNIYRAPNVRYYFLGFLCSIYFHPHNRFGASTIITAIHLRVKEFAVKAFLEMVEPELGPWWVDYSIHLYSLYHCLLHLEVDPKCYQPYDDTKM